MPRQTRAEIEQHFNDQIGFLSASSRAFDAGTTSEATRLAQTLRILFHDGVDRETGRITSPSLVRQIGWNDLELLDSAGEPHPGNVMASCGFTYTNLGVAETTYHPHLDNFPRPHSIPPHLRATLTTWKGRELVISDSWRPFETWWSMPVIRDTNRELFSRSDLVLMRANKDGGAHIEPKISGRYARLSRGNSMGLSRGFDLDLLPMDNPITPSIRQISFEVAVSLNRRINRYRVEELGPEEMPEPD